MKSSRTNVFLTIDLECRRNSINYQGPIYGKLANQKESFGLDFILRLLKEFDLSATFFVEPFFSYKFGQEVLERVCQKILSESQDIQLHLHPYFRSSPGKLLNDAMYEYSLSEQVSLIQEGKDLLEKCGAEKIKAFRAGAFSANNLTYQALASCGIEISSSYNLDYLRKTCQISLPNHFNDFFYYNDQILEMPVTCFCEFDFLRFQRQFRHMQITAVSYPEMKYILDKCPQWNLKNIVLLFHTFEFLNFSDEACGVGSINHINIKRFRKLCEFLSRNQDRFDVKKVSSIEMNGIKSDEIKDHCIPAMPKGLSFLGKCEQVQKRILS